MFLFQQQKDEDFALLIARGCTTFKDDNTRRQVSIHLYSKYFFVLFYNSLYCPTCKISLLQEYH